MYFSPLSFTLLTASLFPPIVYIYPFQPIPPNKCTLILC